MVQMILPDSIEPAFQWAYYVVFPDLGGGETDLQFAVVSTNLPKIEFAVLDVNCKNRQKTLAGRQNKVQFTVMIRDFVEPNIAAVLWTWKTKISPKVGVINKPSEYKKDAQFVVCNGRGEDVQKWKLKGCWPSSIEFGQTDYSATDLIQMTMTLESTEVDME
jgi:hypothetical protein